MDNKEMIEQACEIYPGWSNLIKEIDSKIKSYDPDYKVAQIKEKFGGLRFYFNSNCETDEDFNKLCDQVWNIADRSLSICEICGKEGSPNFSRYGWRKTLCEDCKREEDK